MKTCYVTSLVLNTFHVLLHLLLTTSQYCRYYLYLTSFYRLKNWGTGRQWLASGHVVSGRFKYRQSVLRSCILNHYSITTAYSLYFKEYREIKRYCNAPAPLQINRNFMPLKTKQNKTLQIMLNSSLASSLSPTTLESSTETTIIMSLVCILKYNFM